MDQPQQQQQSSLGICPFQPLITPQRFPLNIKPDSSFDDYIKILLKNGAIISPKLCCGNFQLKNGLTYPGLYTKEPINGEQILVAMPINLLLTSHAAENHPVLCKIFEEEDFYHTGPIWQDRILITYLLYELDKNPQTLWSHMASLFSKQIDILSFWEEEDMGGFRDHSVHKAAQMQRQNFQKQWEGFKNVQSSYQELQLSTFNYENYKWIYTHAVSRCFGSYMNSTYFVPFCEFFNHNCVQVSYSCMLKNQYEETILKLQNERENVKEDKDDESDISSISEASGDSTDYIQGGDFAYDQVHSYTIKWCSKVGFNLKPKETETIKRKLALLVNYLDNELIWQGFTLLYIGEILEKGNLVLNEYMAERKKFAQALDDLETLTYHAANYRKIVKKYYEGLGCSYKKGGKTYIMGQGQKENPGSVAPEPQNIYKKTHKPPEKEYQYFTMMSHQNANFKQNEEVYFEYGRLSNRTLLLRYGFCLEDNTYEHVWVRVSLSKHIAQYPDLFEKIKEKGLPITYQIKLKPYVLNTQIITLMKISEWRIYGNTFSEASSHKDFQQIFAITDLQKQCCLLDKTIKIYLGELNKYCGLEIVIPEQDCPIVVDYQRYVECLKDLKESKGYHGYFADVYHNGKIKILLRQLFLAEGVKQILEEFGKTPCSIKKLMRLKFPQKCVQKMVWGYLKNVSPFAQRNN